ncbi:uncharacterized protein LOC124372110 [Homalodisca vitripennis]|uniref:uncharacterized protein LOC124372110 n=1 Tax=Homalodisca vitripennis TaxID=197043 RepID=UPI001EEBDA01|nr:uncharacterized protein LOC124372110 [Homalodisca vitripennis]
MIKEQIQHSFSGREDVICRKMPVATMLTPVSTIMPRLSEMSLPSSASTSPRLQTLSTPNLRAAPCHVPSTGDILPLDVTKLQQHVSLENFSRAAAVETYQPPQEEQQYTKEVKDSESQTRESQFVFTSVDSLMPPPPPPPRVPTVFLETDLDFHPAFHPQRPLKMPTFSSLGHSRSHENLPQTRCSEAPQMPVGYATVRRTAPDVIAAH